jgi:hypothetical protein
VSALSPNLIQRAAVQTPPAVLPPVFILLDGLTSRFGTPPPAARCRYGKNYKSAAEVQKRFRIFSESLQLVRSTNRKGLYYRLGINRMALTASVLLAPIRIL